MRTELERILIGGLLLNEQADARYLGLSPDDFLSLEASACFSAMCTIKERAGKIDPVLVGSEVYDKTGEKVYAFVSECMNAVVSSHNFIYYSIELKKAIYKDKIRELGSVTSIQIKASNSLEESALLLLDAERKLRQQYLTEEYINDFPNVAAEMFDSIEKGVTPDKLLSFYVDFLNDLTGGGAFPNEYIILAARPGSGKTALVIQIMVQLAYHDEITSFFSLEMTKKQVFVRILSNVARMNTLKLMRDPENVHPSVKKRALDATAAVLEITENILIHDQSSQTIETVRRQARVDVANGAKLIVIDYIQLFKIAAENRNKGVGDISCEIKDMVKELGVPVIVLSQLSRDCEKQNRPPILSDLRDSGSLEQDGNIIWFLHRKEDAMSGFNVTIIQAKARDGETGARPIFLNTDHQNFHKIQGVN